MVGNPPQQKKTYVKVFDCPQCGAGITIRGGAQTLSAVCESCRSIVDVFDPNFKIIQLAQEKQIIKPLLPLGQRGTLHGALWEVIGFMCRCDMASDFVWHEYLLFNPYQGYRWLTQANGHWSYVVMTKEKPILTKKSDKQGVKYGDQSYQLFHHGQARVDYVMGEFYWRVKVGDVVVVDDYICPPKVLSRERDIQNQEESWSISHYLEPETVRDAFKLPGDLPPCTGVAPNQPSKAEKAFPKIVDAWFYFIGILILVQCFNLIMAKNETAYSNRFNYSVSQPNPSIVTEPFELKYGLSNVNLLLNTSVSNDWLSLDAELVNEMDGKSYSVEPTVEYYYGYDGGESWQEGSQTREILLSSIPEGTYHLNIDPQGAQNQSFTLALKRKVVNWGNFLWSCLFLSIIPLLAWFSKYSYEVKRWSDSDYSPYNLGSDEDD